MNCANCDEKECRVGKDCTGLAGEIFPLYREPGTKLVHDAAAGIEKNFYMKIPRVAELIEYVKLLSIKKLGIAFCIGLSEEARIAADIFSRHCTVHSVCCKVCGIPKSDIGQSQLREDAHESICNPLAQAVLLNREKVHWKPCIFSYARTLSR